MLDQASKYLILRYLKPNQLFPLLGVMDIHHVHNTGAAFGILPAGGHFFVTVALVVLGVLALSWRRIAEAGALTTVALGMIAGGTLGNLIDRLRFGYVVDFLDLRWWPVFNLADSAICVGVGLLMWKLLRTEAPADDEAP